MLSSKRLARLGLGVETTTYEPKINNLNTKATNVAKMGFCMLNGHKILKLKVIIIPFNAPENPKVVFLYHPSLKDMVKVQPEAKIKGKFIYLCSTCNTYAWFEK